MKITLNLTKNKQFKRKISNAMDELLKNNAHYPLEEYKLVMSGVIDVLFVAKLMNHNTLMQYYQCIMCMNEENLAELRGMSHNNTTDFLKVMGLMEG